MGAFPAPGSGFGQRGLPTTQPIDSQAAVPVGAPKLFPDKHQEAAKEAQQILVGLQQPTTPEGLAAALKLDGFTEQAEEVGGAVPDLQTLYARAVVRMYRALAGNTGTGAAVEGSTKT
jgi:hypothetical protein